MIEKSAVLDLKQQGVLFASLTRGDMAVGEMVQCISVLSAQPMIWVPRSETT